ncbi:MAG: SipW-dependent-type signal peptide-containing protein, partial [Longicatena sp.]
MNKKRLTATVAAMALTGVMAVAGTLAYMQQVTETKQNVFTSSKDIDTELTEETFEQTVANNYYPGQTILKNPVMHNESVDGTPIYVATKLTFKDNDGNIISRADFEAKYAKILDFNTTDWGTAPIATMNDKGELYMNATVLSGKGSKTNAIFTKTQVLAGINEVI